MAGKQGSDYLRWGVEGQKQQGSGTVNRQPKPHVYRTQSTAQCCGTLAPTN